MSRFPPRGPRRVASSPASVGTIKTLRFPAVYLASLRFLRSAIPREHTAAFVSPVVAACRTTGLELVTRFSGRESLPWKQQGLPSSWGTRMSICTCSSTPVGRDVPHQSGTPARSSLKRERRLQHAILFRGSIAWLLDSLSTLRSAGYPSTTQDSLPAAGYALPGGHQPTQGSDEKFHPPKGQNPLLPSFPWRNFFKMSRSRSTRRSSFSN